MMTTREEMLAASAKRIARRSYNGQPLTETEVQQIQEILDEINAESGLNIELIADGAEAFENMTVGKALFKNVKSLFLLKGNKDLEHLDEKCGYYGEKLVLEMTNMGLGTCIVGGTLDRSKFNIPEDERFICTVLVGHVNKFTFKEKVMRFFSHLGSKKVKDMLVSYHDVPDWVQNGMKEVVHAPSARNNQKTRFVNRSRGVKITTYEDYKFDLVDMGIAKLHFEIGAGNGHFPLGNNVFYIVDDNNAD